MADQSVSELVFRGTDGELFTTSERIAEGTKADHASVIKLVRRYQADLEEFGKVGFQIRLNPQGSPTEIAVLAEPQATLLLTYMRNSEIVRAFKKRLVKSFYAMRQALREQSRQSFALPPDLVEQQRRTDHALALLADCQRQFHGETMGRFDRIETRLDALEESAKATSKRRPFGATALREWNGVLLMRYDGRCPCCQETRIVDAFGRPLEGVYEADHWRSPSHNKVSDGWPVCKTCNRQVLEQDRLAKQYAFQHFHSLRKSIYRGEADRAIEQLGFFAAESA